MEGDTVPEALPAHLSCAQNMGYAQSKLVTEHLCQIATDQTGISAYVLRIGQVIGDTAHGIWNATEAIPMMLQSALTIGALPRLDEAPRWLPVDTVAKTVIDITSSDSAPSGVFNVVNPRAFHWARDLLPHLHASGLQFSELGQRDWIARLRASNPDPIANPPYKLLQFFSNKYDRDSTPQTREWHTQKAQTWSDSLSEAPVLDQGLVDKMIEHFRSNCWAKSNASSRG